MGITRNKPYEEPDHCRLTVPPALAQSLTMPRSTGYPISFSAPTPSITSTKTSVCLYKTKLTYQETSSTIAATSSADSSSATPSTSPGLSSSSISGIIAGSVVGGIAVIGILALGYVWGKRLKYKAQPDFTTHGSTIQKS